jgi:hypothetical protein
MTNDPNERDDTIHTDTNEPTEDEADEIRLDNVMQPNTDVDDAAPMETMDEADLPPARADLADDAQERQIDDLDAQQLADRNMGDDEAMYGGDETDYDHDYYDNEDEHQYK